MQTGAMGHAVELLFDPTPEAAIKGLWARLETAGLPSLASRTHRRHRPHISLSVAERIDTGTLQNTAACPPAAPPASAAHLPERRRTDRHRSASRCPRLPRGRTPGRDALRARGLSPPRCAVSERRPDPGAAAAA